MCPGLVCPILSLLEDDLCSIHEVMDVIETKKPYLSKAEVVNETHNFLERAYKIWIKGRKTTIPLMGNPALKK